MSTEEFDFTFRSLGSIAMLTPNTPEAHEWVSENLPADHMTFAGAIVIEWRYSEDIVYGILNDGLTIEVIR